MDLQKVTNHAGMPLLPGWDFFAAAPEQIGELLSAQSTLPQGEKPRTASYRQAVTAACALAGLGTAWGIHRLFGPLDQIWSLIWSIGLPACGAWIGWACTRFSHTVTYVGTRGIASICCTETRENVTGNVRFLFAAAAELRTAQTRNYTNGVYTGTNYSFTWNDSNGKTAYELGGSYSKEDGDPEPGDVYHFAAAAERAWNVQLLERLVRQLEKEGSIRFNLSGADFVLIGEGFMEFSIGGKKERIEAGNIDTMTIGQGEFIVKRKGADDGWFFKDGVFTFQYGEMANAQAFLFALEKLVGLSFS